MSKLSIVIPALNEEKFLPNLLTSLTKQTRMDFEVVVVDGSSKDNTVALARSFGPKLPKLQVCVSERAGLPLQRNMGPEPLPENGWYSLMRIARFSLIPSNDLRVSSKNRPRSFLPHGFDRTVKHPVTHCLPSLRTYSWKAALFSIVPLRLDRSPSSGARYSIL